MALWTLLALPGAHAADLTALVYHDVGPDPGTDPYNVSGTVFVAQMDLLRNKGYQPVSLDFLARVQRGEARLPDKALLLTFDDGLKSYRNFVVPTLAAYGYPSVVSVVGAWADGTHVPPGYNGRLMTWDDLRELRRTPLVEIVSHSHDLHHGISANPQGNEGAAATTRQYFRESGRYESEDAFRRRIRQDVELSVAEFQRQLGLVPRAIAWPYGYYDQVLSEEAARAGIGFQLTMDSGPTSVQQLPVIRRIIVRNTSSLADFLGDLQFTYRLANQRVVEFNLDPFRNLSDAARESLLSTLLDALKAQRVGTVLISPFTAEGRGAYFANRQMPVAADILNRITHQIVARLRIQHVYLELPAGLDIADAADMYADLARLNTFTGVVFETPAGSDLESRIRDIVRYYHPNALFGAVEPQHGRRYDFTILRVAADASPVDMEKRIRLHVRDDPELVVMLESQNGHERDLTAKLGLLQQLGLRRYGYGPFDFAGPARVRGAGPSDAVNGS